MAYDYVELILPPGLLRTGTERQSKGRYIDASLVRWYGKRLGPIGGWRVVSLSAGDVSALYWIDGDAMAWVDGDDVYWTRDTEGVELDDEGRFNVAGVARAILTWRDNSNQAWAAIGTHTSLYVMSVAGFLYSITPSSEFLTEGGFDLETEGGLALLTESTPWAEGRADAVYGGGYGAGVYGSDLYGAPRESQTVLLEATQWTLDTWGQYLVGCMGGDGLIYQWTLDTTSDAVVLANAPTAEAIVVTAENFLMALGADGNPRKVRWSDQASNTVWTALPTNQAGDKELATNGRLRFGVTIRGGTLLFTDVDVHLATYIGGQLVYGFGDGPIASGCGAISKQCAAVGGTTAYWMGKDGFWAYNGYVQPLPCDLQDAIFTDKTTEPYRLNRAQSSKVHAEHRSEFGEIWWKYPSGDSIECDRIVVFNYREGHWSNHVLARTCGTDREAFGYPLMVDPDGYVYEHEIGIDHEGLPIFAESGPIELGSGDRVMQARELVPDEETEGECQTYFKVRDYPASAEETFGPYDAAQPTPVRFGGRSVKVRYQQQPLEMDTEAGSEILLENGVNLIAEDGGDTVWRIGAPRLSVRMAGRR